MFLAVIQNSLRLLFIEQIESQMGGHVADGKGKNWFPLQAVAEAFRIGVGDVVCQSCFREGRGSFRPFIDV
jgi:hypothetical protein